jgi:hypothetical protein
LQVDRNQDEIGILLEDALNCMLQGSVDIEYAMIEISFLDESADPQALGVVDNREQLIDRSGLVFLGWSFVEVKLPGRGLAVAVDQESPLEIELQDSGHVDGQFGLADAALVVSAEDDHGW